jgi:hypothetical protein
MLPWKVRELPRSWREPLQLQRAFLTHLNEPKVEAVNTGR